MLKRLDIEKLITLYISRTVYEEMAERMATTEKGIPKDLYEKYRASIRKYIEYIRDIPIDQSEKE